ncbi:MAG: cytochrome d ubiquinol oxidase subunit II [Clostridiales bacterium]|nr:cytochrome d ubiquinol oxidase subunit II [Clostridiales bacterium]
MDDFLETVARRHNQGFYTFLYIVAWVFIVLFGLIAVMHLSQILTVREDGLAFSLLALIIAVVFGGLTFLLWRRKDYCHCEYDYTFTNGILDVSQVLNNRRRRYLTALDMKTVTRCGPARGPGFQKTLQEPGIKKHNWFLNRDGQLYYFFFTKNNVRHLAVVELQKEMVDVIHSKKYLQSGVWVDENGKSEFTYGISGQQRNDKALS